MKESSETVSGLFNSDGFRSKDVTKSSSLSTFNSLSQVLHFIFLDLFLIFLFCGVSLILLFIFFLFFSFVLFLFFDGEFIVSFVGEESSLILTEFFFELYFSLLFGSFLV